MQELTITDLAKSSGFTVNHLTQLVRRGVLPPGRKEGQARLLPYNDCMLILAGHKPMTDWKKRVSKKSVKPKASKVRPQIDWSSLR